MKPIYFQAFALLSSLLPTLVASADDFEIVATITTGEKQVRTERTEESTARRPARPRPAATIGASKTASVSWHAENTGQATEFQDTLVHFFVVEEDHPGQQKVPDLKGGIYEGAMTMDFKPGEKAEWKFKLKIDKPGSYLLRVETIGLSKTHGHEHFAALDLIVK